MKRISAAALVLAGCGGTVLASSGGDASSASPDASPDHSALDVGSCPPGRSLCAGTCVNEQTDNAHCGGCDIVCEAGTCQGGRCTCPSGQLACEGACVETCLLSLATTAGPITGIAVDAESVYWLDTTSCSPTTCAVGRVMSVPKAGGTTDDAVRKGVEPCTGESVCPGKLMKRTPK